VLAANRPIVIMDEPQKMEGAATQTALKRFKPLFVLYYSATHKTSCTLASPKEQSFTSKLHKIHFSALHRQMDVDCSVLPAGPPET